MFEAKGGTRHVPPTANVLFLSVYRHRNAATLLSLVSEAKRNRWAVRLWALDEVHPDLAVWSRGVGRGARFDLLNSLASPHDGSAGFEWVVITDDDVALERGSLSLFVSVAERAGFSLVQAAHSDLSYRSHKITRWRPFSVARLTTFVESGPVFAVNRAWSTRVLPFPSGYGTGGWGVDLQWCDLPKAGARLGIVDLVTIRHLVPAADQYDAAPELARVNQILRQRGVRKITELQRTLGVWRPWQIRAPWLSPEREATARRSRSSPGPV